MPNSQTDDPDQGTPHLRLNTLSCMLSRSLTHTGPTDVSFPTVRKLLTKPTCLSINK